MSPTKEACSNIDCELYPYYGVAPHECFYKKGPDFIPGQSTLLPRSQWPRNFVLDVLSGEDPATITYPNACGVYYCPTCLTGAPAFRCEGCGEELPRDLLAERSEAMCEDCVGSGVGESA